MKIKKTTTQKELKKIMEGWNIWQKIKRKILFIIWDIQLKLKLFRKRR